MGQFEISLIVREIIMAEKLNKKTNLTDYEGSIKQAKLVINDSENLILQLKASIKAAENLLVVQRMNLEKI